MKEQRYRLRLGDKIAGYLRRIMERTSIPPTAFGGLGAA